MPQSESYGEVLSLSYAYNELLDLENGKFPKNKPVLITARIVVQFTFQIASLEFAGQCAYVHIGRKHQQ